MDCLYSDIFILDLFMLKRNMQETGRVLLKTKEVSFG
jgi:hypothetical protein